MENSQLDSFLSALLVLEESHATSLNSDQIKKLQLIQTKVGEIVKKVESIRSTCSNGVKHPIPQAHIASESQVHGFTEFTEINEMIRKRGNKWVVMDRAGKKVLGTHPSREKALKQLRAIEISKHGG